MPGAPAPGRRKGRDVTETLASGVRTGRYEMDPANSRLGFSARYAMVTTVHGWFADFSGQIQLEGDAFADSRISVTVDTASIDSGQNQRDEHLRSPDFLDAAGYPHMLFRSTAVAETGPGRYRVDGELTIRDVTRPLTLDFTLTGTSADAAGRELVGFTGTGRFDRTDFGLTWNAILETGGVLVSHDVDLQLDVTLIRPQYSAAGRAIASSEASRRRAWFGWLRRALGR